ncbi:hypothetical protein AU476_19325 [Cupriavidus sp. UYMSc13B]|nr:hypothetical protein AU476_19325 [Cupriavidus sp. UYMSc13B]
MGSDSVVKQGELAQRMPDFYRVLFTTGNLDAALRTVPAWSCFHAERFLAVPLGRFLRHACMGRGATRRIEAIVTRRQAERGPLSPQALRQVRLDAKAHVRSGFRRQFAACVQQFLPHRNCSFTVDALEAWVRSGV